MDNVGLHLIYSQFRTLEGIALIAEMLKFHGFAQFKISKNTSKRWFIDIDEVDKGKPTFALYTGTETAEEKEILRHIYNGDWHNIPDHIAQELRASSGNNNLGEIIKVLMITSSGSEGINLKMTRFVHILDPYWHPVRGEQVIGRARRICSHANLPKELQTVEVFVYLMTIPEEFLKESRELMVHDKSKITKGHENSTDEYLFEMSEVKAQIASQLTDIIKISSFDRRIHSDKEEYLKTTFNEKTDSYNFNFVPDYNNQQQDAIYDANLKTVEHRYSKIKANNNQIYAYKDEDLFQREIPVYDENSIISTRNAPAVPLMLGHIIYENGIPVFRAVK